MTSPASLFWRRSRDVRLALDCLLWAVAVPAAFFLRLERFPSVQALAGTFLAFVAVHTFVSMVTGLDRRSWTRMGGRDLALVGVAAGVDALGVAAIVAWPSLELRAAVPVSVPIIAGLCAFLLMVAARLGVRAWANQRRAGGGERVLVVGAGGAGPVLARSLREDGNHVVGFVDPDPTRQGLIIDGMRVLGDVADAPEIVRTRGVTLAVLATGEAPLAWRETRLALEEAGVRCRVLPGLDDVLLAERPRDIQAAIRRFTESDRPTNVLVIGGAGYIGSALVPILLRKGYQVRVLDLLLYGKEPLAPFLDDPKFELLQGDFRNVSRLVEAMQGVDTVIHLGAIVGDPACALNEELTVETNLMATKLVADVAKGHGIRRFIFASTCSVYGASDGILDENSPLNPVSLYARTKIAAERVLLRLKDDTFRPVILRFGTVYGFSGRTRFDLVINLLAAKAATDGKITLTGGDQWRPFIHVHDVANGVAQVMETPGERLKHDVYNVGSDEQNYTLEGAAKVIQQVVPTSQVVEMGAGSDRRNYRVSFQRIRSDVGFTPEWTVEQGVRQVVDAIRSGKVTNLQDPMYSNVKFLTTGGMEQFDKRVYGMVLDALDETIPEAATP